MATMAVYNLTVEDLCKEYDTAKDLVISDLIRIGLLEESVGQDWAASHTFIIRKPNAISRWVKRFLGTDQEPDIARIFLVDLHVVP